MCGKLFSCDILCFDFVNKDYIDSGIFPSSSSLCLFATTLVTEEPAHKKKKKIWIGTVVRLLLLTQDYHTLEDHTPRSLSSTMGHHPLGSARLPHPTGSTLVHCRYSLASDVWVSGYASTLHPAGYAGFLLPSGSTIVLTPTGSAPGC